MIRSLTVDDSDIYFGLRNKIFHSSDARFYSDSFEREHALTEEGKKGWCAESHAHCIRGTFEEGELVGITMLTLQGGPTSPLVELEAAYMDKRFRGTGKSRIAYEDAINWAKENGYQYVIGFIRDTFTPAQHLCEHLGFIYAYTIHKEVWADGSTCDTKAYVMSLDGSNAEERRANTLFNMDDILSHAQGCIHAPQLQLQQRALDRLEEGLSFLQGAGALYDIDDAKTPSLLSHTKPKAKVQKFG